ncbi:uncharacterized protein [Notothenia coriiceps]|uniref:Ig-like domain-containing protein n=1 Tax=Notothenia coriiceps TaxID=8208 RepID=A0A6I9PX21_9TELE|nr:PREDICTED: uncharacterized protein LOC104964896 [Notothenia coriiceps]
MQRMARLAIILMLVLHFEANIHGEIVYTRPGENASLPCVGRSFSDPTCSNVAWLFNRYSTLPDVWIDFIGRSLDSDCSLVVKNVSAEDVGLYKCGGSEEVYLNLLTISPSPLDADPMRDGEVKLKCSLFRHSTLGFCQKGTIPWVDETGTVLLDEDVGYHFHGQEKCVSSLTVRQQSGHNRKYTCRFEQHSGTKIQSDYTPDFLGGNQTEISNPDNITDVPHSYAMWAVRIAGVVVIIVSAVLIIKRICNTNCILKDKNKFRNDEYIEYDNGGVRLANARWP